MYKLGSTNSWGFSCIIGGFVFSFCLAACSPAGTNEGTGNHETYQFSSNGCDTGTHDFTSPDPSVTKKQLCDALQDSKLNHFCAEDLRKEFFNKKCSGFTWSSIAVSNPSDPSSPISSSNPTTDVPKERSVHDSISNLLVDSYQLSPSLTGDLAVSLKSFIEDMKVCGLSVYGSNCKFSSTDLYESFRSSGSIYEIDSQTLFGVELELGGVVRDSNTHLPVGYTRIPVWYIFKIDFNGNYYVSTNVRILRELKPANGRSFKDYLADANSVQEMASIMIAPDTLNAAWKRLQDPSDVRSLYHLPRIILNLTSASFIEETKTALLATISKNQDLVRKGENRGYQALILEFLDEQLKASAQLITQICSGLMESRNPKVKQLAASYILDFNSSREELKPLVRQALNDEEASVRRRAVSGLSKAHPSLEDQNLIIPKIDDEDSRVRKIATDAVNQFPLVPAHVDALANLLKSSRSETRRTAVGFLERIPGTQATLALVSDLDDMESDIRQEIIGHLQSRPLTEEMVPALVSHLDSLYSEVRGNIVTFLGKIPGTKVTLVFIAHLEDIHEDVRSGGLNQLQSRPLTEEMVPALEGHIDSLHSEVRKQIIAFLGKIPGSQVTLAFINHLDDIQGDVRTGAIKQLQSRPLTEEMVPALVNYMDSIHSEVRGSIIIFLGKISGPQVTLAFINHLDDIQSDVRTGSVNQLESRALTEDMVDSLANKFDAVDRVVRKNVAKFLGRIKSKKALDALTAQLENELDGGVKVEIKRAIEAIRKG